MNNKIKFTPLNNVPTTPFKFSLYVCKGLYLKVGFDSLMSFLLSLTKILQQVIFAGLIEYFSRINIAEFSWKRASLFFIAVLATETFANIVRYFRETRAESLRHLISWRTQEFALKYASKHSLAYLKEQKSGQLAQRVINLTDAIWSQVFAYGRFMSNIWLIAISFYFISQASLYFLLLVIGFGSLSAFVSAKISKTTKEAYKKSDTLASNYAGNIADSISNILLIKIFGQEKSELKKVNKELENVNESYINAVKKENIITSLQEFIILTFRVCGILLAVDLWQNGVLSVGKVILILMLLDDVLTYFQRLLMEIVNLNSRLGKLGDALTFLQVKHEITDDKNAKDIKIKNAKIEFNNVDFAYSDNKKIFSNFNLVISEGEKIGITGTSGGGKSTLINLLLRNYDVNKGKILINNKDIKNLKDSSLKDNIALISQDNILFHRSLKRNIAYGKPNASFEEIEKAAKLAYADDFIQKTEHGYLSITGERGVKLSGGQRQRIAIARAILKNAPILILDEATSALDNNTEDMVIHAIDDLMKDKTVICIAHRLSTLKNMDRIIVLDKGNIVQSGTFNQLSNADGIFKHLLSLQN